MSGPEGTETAPPSGGSVLPADLTRALHAIRSGAYMVDELGCILAVNAVAEGFLGRSAADLLGHDAHDLLHCDAHGHPLPRSQCAMRQAFHAGRAAQARHSYFLGGDGTVLPVSWTITPCDIGSEGTATLVLFHTPDAPADDGGPDGPRTIALSELERLALLAETTGRLTSTLDVDEALRRLVELVVPRLADWVVVDLITERDEVWRHTVVHAEGDALVELEELKGPMPPVPAESPMPLSRALRGRPPPWPRPGPTGGSRTPASPSNSGACSTTPACTPRRSPRSAAPGRCWAPSPWAGPRTRWSSPPTTCRCWRT